MALEVLVWYFVWRKVLQAPALDEARLFKVLATSFTFLGAVLLSHYALSNQKFVSKVFPRLADAVVGFLTAGATVGLTMATVGLGSTPAAPVVLHFSFAVFLAVTQPLTFLWGKAFHSLCPDDLSKVRAFGFSLVVYGQAIQLLIALHEALKP